MFDVAEADRPAQIDLAVAVTVPSRSLGQPTCPGPGVPGGRLERYPTTFPDGRPRHHLGQSGAGGGRPAWRQGKA